MKISVLLITIFASLFVFAAPKSDSKAELKPLKETLDRIQKSKLSEFKLEKKVKSDVMGTEKTYQAKAYMSGSLLRFETEQPEKSLVVFDGKTLWVVQYPDKELGGPVQVLRGKITGKQKDHVLLTELLAKGKILKSFDVKKVGEEEGAQIYDATPTDPKIELKKVTLKVKAKNLKSLEYVDDVGNKTTLTVLDQKSNAKGRAGLFSYKPEKGAQVTDL